MTPNKAVAASLEKSATLSTSFHFWWAVLPLKYRPLAWLTRENTPMTPVSAHCILQRDRRAQLGIWRTATSHTQKSELKFSVVAPWRFSKVSAAWKPFAEARNRLLDQSFARIRVTVASGRPLFPRFALAEVLPYPSRRL